MAATCASLSFTPEKIKTVPISPALIDPNLPEFNGNFGKAAFSLFTGGVLKKSKLEAVNQVYQTLRTVWQIYTAVGL